MNDYKRVELKKPKGILKSPASASSLSSMRPNSADGSIENGSSQQAPQKKALTFGENEILEK
jgi:hypothetical protein